jgi:hypothetical protein
MKNREKEITLFYASAIKVATLLAEAVRPIFVIKTIVAYPSLTHKFSISKVFFVI